MGICRMDVCTNAAAVPYLDVCLSWFLTQSLSNLQVGPVITYQIPPPTMLALAHLDSILSLLDEPFEYFRDSSGNLMGALRAKAQKVPDLQLASAQAKLHWEHIGSDCLRKDSDGTNGLCWLVMKTQRPNP